jgi:hypothetical protein
MNKVVSIAFMVCMAVFVLAVFLNVLHILEGILAAYVVGISGYLSIIFLGIGCSLKSDES